MHAPQPGHAGSFCLPELDKVALQLDEGMCVCVLMLVATRVKAARRDHVIPRGSRSGLQLPQGPTATATEVMAIRHVASFLPFSCYKL